MSFERLSRAHTDGSGYADSHYRISGSKFADSRYYTFALGAADRAASGSAIALQNLKSTSPYRWEKEPTDGTP